MNPITILIFTDQKLLREAWTALLNHDGRFKVVGENAISEAMFAEAERLRPDVVLVDASLPTVNALQVLPILGQSSPASKAIVILNQMAIPFARSVIQMGAKGLLTKTGSANEMLEAIIKVQSGKIFISRCLKDFITGNLIIDPLVTNKLALLTPRELDIIKLLKDGAPSKQIALTLGISPKTVEAHRYNILKKLGVKNAAAAIDFVNSYMGNQPTS